MKERDEKMKRASGAFIYPSAFILENYGFAT